jgi:hypothetical protein
VRIGVCEKWIGFKDLRFVHKDVAFSELVVPHDVHELQYANIKLINSMSFAVLQHVLNKAELDNQGVSPADVLSNLYLGTSDVSVAVKMVCLNGLAVQCLHTDLRTNVQVVAAAVKQNWMSFKYVQLACNQGDYEAAEATAVATDWRVIKYCHNCSKATALCAVEQNGMALGCLLSKSCRDDLLIIIHSVLQNGMALQFVQQHEHSSKNFNRIVMAAVKQNPMALQFAGCLKDDETIVKASCSDLLCESRHEAFQFASDRLRRTPSFVLQITKLAGQQAQQFSLCL